MRYRYMAIYRIASHRFTVAPLSFPPSPVYTDQLVHNPSEQIFLAFPKAAYEPLDQPSYSSHHTQRLPHRNLNTYLSAHILARLNLSLSPPPHQKPQQNTRTKKTHRKKKIAHIKPTLTAR
ncbi:hypothetical protein PGTUg99_030234 [Puccinia graminis f. sp. tritici]|uniref:Uncharacterized protein n=1 Tax=Puccinia graminis f. sp. tritici TaxID=56615 RepID=A0A5B0R877_PUCGR|nr:hypothetical protein PGTUg99_030234 [Puccinia graminis f. sp. tritici]